MTYSECTPSIHKTGLCHSNRGAVGTGNPSDDGAHWELNQLGRALVFIKKILI
jgi:hypothetical protein